MITTPQGTLVPTASTQSFVAGPHTATTMIVSAVHPSNTGTATITSVTSTCIRHVHLLSWGRNKSCWIFLISNSRVFDFTSFDFSLVSRQEAGPRHPSCCRNADAIKARQEEQTGDEQRGGSRWGPPSRKRYINTCTSSCWWTGAYHIYILTCILYI